MTLSVLIVGSGAREHALGWKIRQSPLCGKLFVAPGNGGTETIAENVPIKATDIKALLAFAVENKIDFTIVGPEDPLALGIVDLFSQNGLKIFGPTQAATDIEACKSYAKAVMCFAKVPTARSAAFNAADGARAYLMENPPPCVVKADGLAGGKGAIMCQSLDEALRAIDDLMVKRIFGTAGDRILIEEYLEG